MNEVTIYRRIKDKFNEAKKDVKHAWWIVSGWGVLSILLYIFINMFPLLMCLLIFVPLAGVLVLLFLSIRKEFMVAKRFPLVYNEWLNEVKFINQVNDRAIERAQPDPNYIKIKNAGLKYFDDILERYGDDKQKIANTIYNAITDSNLVFEIEFFKKYKRFVKDMDRYRGRV